MTNTKAIEAECERLAYYWQKQFEQYHESYPWKPYEQMRTTAVYFRALPALLREHEQLKVWRKSGRDRKHLPWLWDRMSNVEAHLAALPGIE